METTDRRAESDGDEDHKAGTSWVPTTTPVVVGLLGITVILFFAVLTVVSGLGGGMMGDGMMSGGMMGGGMGGSPWLWLPLFIPPLTGFAVLLYTIQQRNQSATGATQPTSTADPVEILEGRYLDADIDLAEYERRLGQLLDIGADGDTHPQVSRLAVRYARGEIGHETLTDRLEQLQSADSSINGVDVETVVERGNTQSTKSQ